MFLTNLGLPNSRGVWVEIHSRTFENDFSFRTVRMKVCQTEMIERNPAPRGRIDRGKSTIGEMTERNPGPRAGSTVVNARSVREPSLRLTLRPAGAALRGRGWADSTLRGRGWADSTLPGLGWADSTLRGRGENKAEIPLPWRGDRTQSCPPW